MNGSEMYVSRDPGIPRIGTPLSFPRRTVYVCEAPFFHATTVTSSPGCERAVTARRIAGVGVAVPFTDVMMLPTGIPATEAGDVSEEYATIPTPGATGCTESIIELNRTPNRRARRMLIPAPTEYIRARSRRGSSFISASAGSTNAPMGNTRNRSPRLSTFTFATRARIPWKNSWMPTAITSAKMPYPSGITGLRPGIPRSSSGEGARSGGMFPTRGASHTRRAVMPTIVSPTITMLRSPNARHTRRNREVRSMKSRPRRVFTIRNGPIATRFRFARIPRRSRTWMIAVHTATTRTTSNRSSRFTMGSPRTTDGAYKDLFRTFASRRTCGPRTPPLRERGAGPRFLGQAVVRGEHVAVRLDVGRRGELLDPVRPEDPVVNPPQLPLPDVDLLLAGRQEARLLEHVEHVAVVHVEAVVDHLGVEPEERDQVVREGADVLLGHPAAPHGCPEGRPDLGHRDDGHRERRDDYRGRYVGVSPPLFGVRIICAMA